MTEETLKLGELLLKKIKNTREALEELEEFLLDAETKPRQRDNELDDGMYTLVIAKNSDASGYCAELKRYGGNVRLMRVIIRELKTQLEEDEEKFAKL